MGFPGGYVGVDVFFVISGYLITSLILSDISAGTFRVVDFWERRVRRILPALALVVLACLVTGWFMFIPSEFDEFGRSVVYQSLLTSNIFFWKTTGYFASTDTQPLLHTWSLAVEEQFYILFPFLLLALKRFGPRVRVCTLGSLAVLSLALSIFGTHFYPSAAFYLLPSRAWELLVGSLLAVLPNVRRPARWPHECLSWLGLTGIVVAALCYGKETRFPGVAALLPSLGAGLVIWTNSSTRTTVGKILSLPPCVFVGLISYSLYLWHWPVVIFSNYWASTASSVSRSIGVVAASLLLATISWKLVETPFRKRVALPGRRQIFVFSGLALATLLLAGHWIHRADGVRSRWRTEALQYIDGRDDKDFRVELDLASARRGELTEIGYKGTDRPIDLLVWGDSHAMAVLHVLNVVCTKDSIRGLAATHSATAPLLDFPSLSRFSLKEDSIPYNWAIANLVKERRIKSVLLVAMWHGYASSTPGAENAFAASLAKTVDVLHNAGAKVFILKDVPKQPFDVPRILGGAAERGRDPSRLGQSIGAHRAQNAYVDSVFEKVAGPSVVLVDPAPLLTDKTGLCPAALNGRALYFDQHHLSIYGETQLQPLFDAVFRENVPGPQTMPGASCCLRPFG
jgi:peptidoglycan/LPS O-acetylase OafA/YrhL